MGYYSEVRCLIWGSEDDMTAFLTRKQLIDGCPALEHFKKWLTNYVVEINKYNFQTQTHKPKQLQILDLCIEDIKWSDIYPEIEQWKTFLTDTQEAGLDHYFIRVGEGDGDETDVESHCTGESHGFLHVGRPQIFANIPDPIKTLELL